MKKIFAIVLMLILLALPHAFAQNKASLKLATSIQEGCGGDRVTLSLNLTCEKLGGMQTDIQWNEGFLTYVENSAAFSDSFSAAADLCMVNDDTANSIRLVYGNTAGCTAKNETIFTAEFLLAENVSGQTYFTIENTKLTNNSASLDAIPFTTVGASVYTQVYDAGSAYLRLTTDSQQPYIGDVIAVNMDVSSSGPAIGSLQGTWAYDPTVFEYVDGSAAFSEAGADAAFTQIINAETPGKLRFVYGSLTGCPEGPLLSAKFKVTGGLDTYNSIFIEDAKATNTETNRLTLMNCYPEAVYLEMQKRPDRLYYSSKIEESGIYNGDTVTLNISADGSTLGGLQANISYDCQQLEYIAGSAAFTPAFAKGASISMVSDSTPGTIRLVYSNTNGYTPDGGDIFTARFVLRTCETDLAPIDLLGIKTIDASADQPTEIPSEFMQGIHWPSILPGHRMKVDEAIAPGCTTAGRTEHKYCSACGLVELIPQIIPALGHSEVTDAAVPASCTTTGLTEGRHCAVCGEVQIAQEVIPAYGHTVLPVQNTCETTAGGNIALEFSVLCGHEVQLGWRLPAYDSLEHIDTAYGENGFVTANFAAKSAGIAAVTAVFSDGVTPECTWSVIIHSPQQITLPKSLYSIDAEAFINAPIQEVILPDGCASIGDSAFAGCTNLSIVHMPDSIVSIAENAFSGCEKLTFICASENAAAAYAAEHAIPFIIG